MKSIDVRLPVQKLCAEYPELKNILFSLGFTDIVNPAMLATAGRFIRGPQKAVRLFGAA